jgi:CheY-like chemotaxis protein
VPEAKKHRILVVEDDDSLVELVKFRLHAEGYEVLVAHNGREGVESARANAPDLVLLDLMMPEMDGYEVLERLRASFITRYLPVIVVTARTQSGDRLRGLEAGANDYVSKPYSFPELMLRVRNLLNWTREHRDMNPLTGLPGNVCIEREMTRRLGLGEDFGFVYVDINNFKAFNDHYGYVRGDEAIRCLAGVLRGALQQTGQENQFLGHVGGDDFVILCRPDGVEPLGEAIIRDFEREVPALYDDADRDRGGIDVPNRRGEAEHFPLMSVTIAGLSSDQFAVTHNAELVDLAFELKRQGKQKGQSALVTERRRGQPASQQKTG